MKLYAKHYYRLFQYSDVCQNMPFSGVLHTVVLVLFVITKYDKEYVIILIDGHFSTMDSIAPIRIFNMQLASN